MKTPLILIGNDDGIYAKGIRKLVEVAKEFGEVIVVAPENPHSAKSHSVTLEKPLQYKKSSVFNDLGVEAFKTSGTPADSIKIALHHIMDRKPDLVLSGINHGSNFSVNIVYSGTLAVAIEGAMHSIPSIAFSLMTYEPDADFSVTQKYAKYLIEKVLESEKQNICLNVNVPYVPQEQIKGMKICRQTKGVWAEEFVERIHPVRNEKYLWLTGKFYNLEPQNTDTDVWATENGYVAVVPIKIDFTDLETLNYIKNW